MCHTLLVSIWLSSFFLDKFREKRKGSKEPRKWEGGEDQEESGKSYVT